jgi:hypothetical protein
LKKTTIVLHQDTSGNALQNWYFGRSIDETQIILSGYRRYEKDATGQWFTAKRWYPQALRLGNMIAPEDIPLLEDVLEQAVKELFVAVDGDGAVGKRRVVLGAA